MYLINWWDLKHFATFSWWCIQFALSNFWTTWQGVLLKREMQLLFQYLLSYMKWQVSWSFELPFELPFLLDQNVNELEFELSKKECKQNQPKLASILHSCSSHASECTLSLLWVLILLVTVTSCVTIQTVMYSVIVWPKNAECQW